ncbi:hypothetical protein ACFXDJ_31980 [Streptomyces sp. NPDC059443]|uniref:hypothetical protein n=1 Tax=unclassified Streptomyces TaxID=2593676 RepID=UPI0036B9B94F
MTAGEAAAGEPPVRVPAPTWKITGGHPDEEQTAVVLAVLAAALVNRAGEREPEPPRTTAPGWVRGPSRELRRAGSWRAR